MMFTSVREEQETQLSCRRETARRSFLLIITFAKKAKSVCRLSVCLSVCLLATLTQNYWSHPHESLSNIVSLQVIYN